MHEMTREEIAAILKRIRNDAGITQKDAASKLGKKQQTIASWESGQSQPDANTLFLLCYLYGTTVDKAFGFSSEDSGFTTEDIELVENYHNLDSYGKAVVDAVLELECKRCQEEQRIIDPIDQDADEFLKEIHKKESETNARSHA